MGSNIIKLCMYPVCVTGNGGSYPDMPIPNPSSSAALAINPFFSQARGWVGGWVHGTLFICNTQLVMSLMISFIICMIYYLPYLLTWYGSLMQPQTASQVPNSQPSSLFSHVLTYIDMCWHI